MTDMIRKTISIPDDLDKKILSFKKTERFVRCSYSEIVRQLMILGMKSSGNDNFTDGQDAS